MTLAPGARLGTYEVQAAIGAGGMGKVYRARDTKLGRDVAIKTLAEEVIADPDRIARFAREAQVLAALNHPHIASIYGFEEANGSQFLVMELVEGETLAERLKLGPIPVAEALVIARQIADALQAAHEKGIIHRDLKPANVAFTAEGQVKVLDFGLAKNLGPADSDLHANPGLTHSPTLTLAATHAGVILGTAAYMAPEQAKGKSADKRSDVWAFGCVLYEMLTGKGPFEAEDVSDTLAAVLRAEPDWESLPVSVPLPVRTLLRGCLEKDRRKRIADVSAGLFVLDHAAALVERTDLTSSAAPVANPRRMASWSAVALIVGAVSAGASTWWLMRTEPPSVVRTTIMTAGPSALRLQGTDRDIAITPDGSRIIYRGASQLLVRSLGQLEPQVLNGVGAPRGVFVSPDGQWVGFFDGNTRLMKVAITGGPSVPITATDGNPRGATWGADGTIIFATNGSAGLQRVADAGGTPTVLTTPSRERGEANHWWPELLPGGQAVLFTIGTGAGADNAQIAVLDLETGTSKVLVRGGSHAHYVGSGHLIYAAAGTLRAVAFDLGRLEVVGPPAPVLEQVVTTAQGAADVAVASNGTIVYVPGAAADAARSLVWVDRTGREEPLPAPARAYVYPRISPDGTRLALDIRDQQNDIWIWDFARRTLTRLTDDPAIEQMPVWTPDSTRIVFSSQREGVVNLFWQAADGTGSLERLIESSTGQQSQTLTPDGSRLVFRESSPKTGLDLMITPLQPPRTPEPLVQTTFTEPNAEISPDGRWLAYESNQSGQFEIYVRPFPNAGSGRWQISTGSGRKPLWARNSRELFYVSTDGRLMGVRVDPGASWRNTAPETILRGPYYYATDLGGGNAPRSFDISADGRRFLMIKPGTGDAAAPENLIVVQNWFEELKRLVPTN